MKKKRDQIAFYNLANLFVVRWSGIFPHTLIQYDLRKAYMESSRACYPISLGETKNMNLPTGLTACLGGVKLAIHAWILIHHDNNI